MLHGEALKQGQCESKVAQAVERYLTSDLQLFFGEYKLAAKSALERGEEFNELMSGSMLCMIETFHRAVSSWSSFSLRKSVSIDIWLAHNIANTTTGCPLYHGSQDQEIQILKTSTSS